MGMKHKSSQWRLHHKKRPFKPAPSHPGEPNFGAHPDNPVEDLILRVQWLELCNIEHAAIFAMLGKFYRGHTNWMEL